MSNKRNFTRIYTTNCRRDLPYVFIVRPNDTLDNNLRVMMMEITEEDEKELDCGRSLSLVRGELQFIIHPDLCYAYGELDLSPNSKDLDRIEEAKWFNSFEIRQFLLSDYDYEHHCVDSDIPGGRWYSSSNIKSYLPYLYACINKPKRVVIFKEYLNTTDLRTAKRKAKNNAKYNAEVRERKKEQSKQRRDTMRQNKVSKMQFTLKY